MHFLLWLIAVVLVVVGIVKIIQGSLLWGICLIVLGLLIGPGGYSLFTSDDVDGRMDLNSIEEIRT